MKVTLMIVLGFLALGQVACFRDEQDYITTFEGHQGPIIGLAIFEEEDRIITAGIFDKKIIVRKLSDLSIVKELDDHKEQLRGVTALRSGKRKYFVSYGFENYIIIWDLITLKRVHTLTAFTERVMKVLQFQGTDFMVTQEDNFSKIWNFVEGGEPVLVVEKPHSSGTRQTVTMTSDPMQFATVGNDHLIKVWDAKTGDNIKEMKTTGGLVYGFIYVDELNILITGDNNGLLQSWYWKVGRNVRIYQDMNSTIFLDLVVIPNSNILVAAGHGNKDIQYFDHTKENLKALYTKKGHTNEVWKLAHQKNTGYVYSCAADYTCKQWTICESKYDYYNLKTHSCIQNCIDKDEKNQICLSTKSGERPKEDDKLQIKLPFIDTVTFEL